MVGLKHHIHYQVIPLLRRTVPLLKRRAPLLKRTVPEKTSCTTPKISRIVGHSKGILTDQAGFSLVELIAVIVILSILAAIALPLYIDLDENARERAIDAGISELNGREGLAWSNIKLTPTGWQDDTSFFATYDKNLGEDYIWSTGDPNTGGGEIKFGISGSPVTLTRTPSTASQPGYWKK